MVCAPLFFHAFILSPPGGCLPTVPAGRSPGAALQQNGVAMDGLASCTPPNRQARGYWFASDDC
jgi:hypothetical protein